MTIDVPTPTPPAHSEQGDTAVLCPGCGYDLRGATIERCSECGLEIDRRAIRTSDLPWAHRRRVGRVRAFWKTVWYVTADNRLIRQELARPQEPRDARRFCAWNAACVAAALILATAVAGAEHGAGPVLVQLLSSAAPPTPMAGPLQDLAVPWSAGVTLLPAVPFYLIALAVYLAGLGRSLMRLKTHPPKHRERARVMSVYAAGPLAWLLPASVVHVVAFWVRSAERQPSGGGVGPRATALALEVVAALVVAVALFGSLYRSGQWFARAHHGGAGRVAAGVGELIGRSILGLVLFLGVVPWCAGLAWIILDSFR
jgi:hypothetical protein